MSVIKWSCWTINLAITGVSATGGRVTWTPWWNTSASYPLTFGRIAPPVYEPVYLERELLDFTLDHYLAGYRATLTMELRTLQGEWTGWPGYGTLDAALSNASPGGYYEVSLNGAGRKCFLQEDSGNEPLDGKNVGISRELVFVRAALVNVQRPPSAIDW